MGGGQARFINRELSWLEFNQRVLDEARDPGNPVLERLKFLAITGSNLDEFFMVRVGGLQTLAREGSARPDPAGLTPAAQLKAIGERVRRMAAEQAGCLLRELEPELARSGVRRLRPGELTPRQGEYLEDFFKRELSAVVTPMATASPDRFPLLVNLSLNLAFRLKPAEGSQAPRFATMPVGTGIRRFLTVPADQGYAFILAEDVLAMLAAHLFPGEEVMEAVPYRITRNADMAVREDKAYDLLEEMKEVLDARRQSHCVRLEIGASASKTLLGFLQKALRVPDEDVFPAEGPLDLSAFMKIAAMDGFEGLKNEPWPPQPSPDLDPRKTVFEELARRDILLLHPYDSFDPVVRFVREAAEDPDVLAIKQILYRTSRNSPVVAALKRAAENGKNVTALVELKARFDEARNIEWAQELEQAGAQVIYGIKGLKTHAKVCIVVRREPQGIMRYAHFGTGNYNEITARLYSDVSYMTSREDLCADAGSFFNTISGYSEPQRFLELQAAPLGLRDALVSLIEGERERKKQKQKAAIMGKMNSLVDPDLIKALYRASRAGVRIMLNVRGTCCLRPGVPGLSENIAVTSIVDRFLEHSRVFCFHHGGDERVFISSADWMPRNLDRRIELLVPVQDDACRKRLIAALETYFADTVKARQLLPDGRYERVPPAGKKKGLRSQEELYRQSREAVRRAEQTQRAVFEPHRPPDTQP